MASSSPPRVVVIGAGAFGGWTALSLVRRGLRVTLVDAWGAGNSRSSSGDETRLIRTMYNGDALYTDLAVRALALWHEAEAGWRQPVLRRNGVLYLFEDDNTFAQASLPLMRDRGVRVEELAPADGAKRFPQFSFDDVRSAFLEPDAGVLLARTACELVQATFEHEGGSYRPAQAQPGPIRSSRLSSVMLGDHATLEADAFVFACGPWLGQVFPDVIGDGIEATRQPIVYFGAPPGDQRFDWRTCPGWIDFGKQRHYGMPGSERRGFKVGDDAPGPPIDPTITDRFVLPEEIQLAREFVARRFPSLARQPVVETRVCQYECSPDNDFLLDRHPDAANVWLIGGGSGHGFKMGPAVGEYVARLVIDGAEPHERFSFARFSRRRARPGRTHPRAMHS